MRTLARALPFLLLPLSSLAPAASAQSVVDRSPNLSGGWVGAPGVLHFNFLHRFSSSDAPERKVSSAPTFLVAAGLPGRTLVGVNYATSSDVAARYPNEWELFGRALPLARERGAPLDVGVQAGYNLAAASLDGELSLARWVGPLRVVAAGRALSDGYHAGEPRFAAAGGAVLRLSRLLTLAGDVASLLDRGAGERVAWGAGVQLAIPYTPHTLSLQATNTNTGTLQGASRGSERVRYGFEFTIPVTLRRYLRPPSPTPPAAAPDTTPRIPPSDTAGWIPTEVPTVPPAGQAPAEVRARIRGFRYLPERVEIRAGTTLTWTNEDQVPHTVTADDGSFDSGSIAPGGSWQRTFREPGTYPFHCTPHPFMQGVIVVR